MTSPVDICNLALSKLGEEPIISLLDPQSRIEQLCKHWFDPCRRSTLEEYEWSFAVERFTSEHEIVPVGGERWGYEYQHLLPEGVIRLLEVRSTPYDDEPNSTMWQLERDILLTDAPTIYGRAVFDIEDSTRFSPAFVQALAVRIAMEISIAVTSNMDIYDRLAQEYLAKLTNAGNTDALQGRRKRVHTSNLVTRR